MKIFGINIQTKKELKEEIKRLKNDLSEAEAEIENCDELLEYIRYSLPFDLDMTVFEVQLKNKNGKFTTARPSKEHSVIVPVVVTEKNYFRLAKKFMIGVFYKKEEAEEYLTDICSDDETIHNKQIEKRITEVI
jgi:hypothetical protein